MKRRRLLRHFLIVALGVGVAVVVAGYAILSNLEVDDVRAVLERQARTLTGRDLTISGPITLQRSLSPVISVSDVSYANAEWGAWPEMVGLERLELEVALLPLLSGDLQVRRLILVRPTILLETDAQGRGNWVLLEDQSPAEARTPSDGAFSIAPWFNEIAIRDGRAIYRDGPSGRETLVALDSLTLRAAYRDAPIALTLSGRYNAVPVTGEGVIGTYGDVIGGKPVPVALRLASSGSVVEIEGVLGEPREGHGFSLGISARGPSLADLSGLADLDLPHIGPYTLSVHLKEDAPRILVTGLALRVGESDLSGNLTLDVSADPVSVSGAVVSRQIRVEDLEPARERPPPDREKLFSDAPLPLDGLEEADVALAVTIEAFHVTRETILRDIDLEVTLKDARLDVPAFAAGFEGARLLGSATWRAAAAAPVLDLDLRALGVAYGRLLQTFADVEGVAGAVDVELKGRGRGDNLEALAASWDGRLDIVGGEGRVSGDLLGGVGGGLVGLLAGWREADADLRLTCVVGRWPIVQGVATADAVLIDTGAMTVAATGKIDLRDETVNLRISPRAKGTSLMSFAVPVRLSGPLADPQVGPDPLGTAVGAARIAGMVINPLAAGAAIILDSEVFTDRNPCVAALRGETGDGAAGASGNPAIDRAAEGLEGTVGRPNRDDGNGQSAPPTDNRSSGPAQSLDRR